MSYKIELLLSGIPGARPTMFRGGRKFEVGEPAILDLTDEQLEVFKNDWRFKVSNSTDPGETLASGTAQTSETVPPTEGIFTEETVGDETETVADTSVAPEEVAGSKNEETVTVESLLKDFSRDELNELASIAGIKSPEIFFNNKTEVAQAIVDAQ